jgi:hypothetical protein
LKRFKNWKKWKGVCKRVKLWPFNVIVLEEVRLKEQGQFLHTPKKNYLHLFILLELLK